jgi:hypothetical protein
MIFSPPILLHNIHVAIYSTYACYLLFYTSRENIHKYTEWIEWESLDFLYSALSLLLFFFHFLCYLYAMMPMEYDWIWMVSRRKRRDDCRLANDKLLSTLGTKWNLSISVYWRALLLKPSGIRWELPRTCNSAQLHNIYRHFQAIRTASYIYIGLYIYI